MEAVPIIADSARKHGVSDADMLHAYLNPLRIFDLDEGLTMVIGANQAAIVFENGSRRRTGSASHRSCDEGA